MPYMPPCHISRQGMCLAVACSSCSSNFLLTIHSAGMTFEDGAVLGECLSRLPKTNTSGTSNPKSTPPFLAQKRHALAVYQACREKRTQMIVERGNRQQYLYHLHDGEEQEERDHKLRMVPPPAGEALAWRDSDLAPILLGYNHLDDVSKMLRGTRESLCLTVRKRLMPIGIYRATRQNPRALRKLLRVFSQDYKYRQQGIWSVMTRMKMVHENKRVLPYSSKDRLQIANWPSAGWVGKLILQKSTVQCLLKEFGRRCKNNRWAK